MGENSCKVMQELFSIPRAVPNPPKPYSFTGELCLFSCIPLSLQHKVRLHLMVMSGWERASPHARPLSLPPQCWPFSSCEQTHPGRPLRLSASDSHHTPHSWESHKVIIEISLSFFTLDLVIVAFLRVSRESLLQGLALTWPTIAHTGGRRVAEPAGSG